MHLIKIVSKMNSLNLISILSPPFSTSAPHRLDSNILHPHPMDNDAVHPLERVGEALSEDTPTRVSLRYMLSPEIRFSLSRWAHHPHKKKQYVITNCSNLLLCAS